MRMTSGTRLGGLVDDLVGRAQREVHYAHLHYRLQACERHPDARAQDRGLRDRRVDHTRGAELLLQPLVLLEHTAAADVLADHDDVQVLRHGGLHREACGLGVGHQRHCPPPVSCTSR
jgi:hypothetical protein